MLLEKFENLLELSFKQLVVQSRLASSILLGSVWCVKNQMLMLFVAKLGIFVSSKSCASLSLIKFHLKGNNKPKSLSKRVQVISCQIF